MRKYVPLREFIFDRLYHPTAGYFCKKGTTLSNIRFSGRIISISHKLQKLNRV